jgi:hypothetical protein
MAVLKDALALKARGVNARRLARQVSV